MLDALLQVLHSAQQVVTLIAHRIRTLCDSIASKLLDTQLGVRRHLTLKCQGQYLANFHRRFIRRASNHM